MNFQPVHPETQPPRGKYLSRETACIYNDPPRIYNCAECAPCQILGISSSHQFAQFLRISNSRIPIQFRRNICALCLLYSAIIGPFPLLTRKQNIMENSLKRNSISKWFSEKRKKKIKKGNIIKYSRISTIRIYPNVRMLSESYYYLYTLQYKQTSILTIITKIKFDYI